MHKLTMIVGDADYLRVKELPVRMTISKIVRTILTALRTSDAEWAALLKEDPKLREAKEWIREHIVGKFLK